MPAATPERFIVWQNGAPLCAGLVQNVEGDDLTQASVTSVTRSIYRIDGPDDETLVEGPTALTKADCISDTRLTTHGWDTARDPDGFNFYDEPPGSTFALADQEYAVEYKIVPVTGSNTLKERYTGRTRKFSS